MKKLLLLASVALVGCGTVVNNQFDNVEASRYVDVAVASRLLLADCDRPVQVVKSLPVLSYLAVGAQTYSELKSNNPQIAAAGKILVSQVADLNTRYASGQPSQAYCTIKLTGIADAAALIARSIGKKELETPLTSK